MSWARVLLAVLGVAALATHAYGGSARAAHASAARELRWTLLPDEIVLAALPAAQRYWWNYFSATHGVLAVTDRRIIFVGVEPSSLTAPSDGPPTFETREFSHDEPLAVTPGPVFLGTASGVVLATPSRAEAFALDAASGGGQRQGEVVGLIERARAAHSREIELARLASYAAPPPPPVYRTHLVRRGQSLSMIAKSHHMTADELRELNDLTGDVIRVGQQLLVPVIP